MCIRDSSKTLKIKNDVTASFISRIPDVVSVKKTQFDETKLEESVLSVLNDALESYDSMRSDVYKRQRLQSDSRRLCFLCSKFFLPSLTGGLPNF